MGCCIPATRLAGMIPPREKQGNNMTDLNNEVRELSIGELDKVSGGKDNINNIPVDVTLNKAVASNKSAAAVDAYIRGWAVK
jgi:hypothetical protein